MSYRVRLFQGAVVQPLVKSNYWVYIPQFELSVIRAEAASLPFPQYSVLECNHMGRPVYFPGVKTIPSSWTVTVAEDVVGSALFSMFTTVLIEQFQSGIKLHKFDILVAPTVGHSDVPIPHLLTQLKGCWVQSISGVEFSADGSGTPIKIQVTFKYDNIENVTLGAAGADPFNLEKV